MSVNVAKLTVTVPRPLAASVDEVASQESRTRSDVVREAIEHFLKERSERKLMEEFREYYAGMTPEEHAAYLAMAEEAQAGANEALASVIGAESEGEWW